MKPARKRLILAAALLLLPASPATAAPEPDGGAGTTAATDDLTPHENGPRALRSDVRAPESYKVLVFTKTAGTRRPSIQDGVNTIRSLGQANGFTVTVTQDAGAFT